MTDKELDTAVATVATNIIKAAKDYQNNPEKAEAYIRKKCVDILHAGIAAGKLRLTDELFEPDMDEPTKEW